MTTYWFGLAIQALDKAPNVHPVLAYSFFQGSTLLGRPDKGYKTMSSWRPAWVGRKPAAAAVKQVQGKKFAITAGPSTYPWNNLALSLGGCRRPDRTNACQDRYVLAEAGTDKTKLISAYVWLSNISDFASMNSVWERWIAEGCAPARA
jgi:ABC-type nitrate/sulfonate/bicarbonate transport system substrate-binding protein